MPPSQNVAQPAMDHLTLENGLRMKPGNPPLVSPGDWLPGRRFLDTEFFHAAIEGLTADPELAGSLRHDVAVVGEHAFDRGPIEHRLIGARG